MTKNPLKNPENITGYHVKVTRYKEPVFGQEVEKTRQNRETKEAWEAASRLPVYADFFQRLKKVEDWLESLPRDEKGRIF